MAKGTEEKEIIKEKILEVFQNSFCYDKEIRIPINDVQIKCVLTCAKVNVENGKNTVMSSTVSVPSSTASELTEQEKKETADLLASLNL